MKKILVLLAAILFTSLGNAKKPDFAGTWILNTSESTIYDEFSMAPDRIVITVKKNKLTMENSLSFSGQVFRSVYNYNIGGDTTVNKDFSETVRKSTVKWGEGKKTIIISTDAMFDDGSPVTIKEILRVEGNRLKNKSEISSDFGSASEEFVYDRAE